MATPAPKKEIDQLFKDYIAVRSDPGQVNQLEWRAMGLAKRHPHSFEARTLYGAILLSLAKRVEALEHIEAAYGLNPGNDFYTANILAVTFANIGLYDEALQIYSQLISMPWQTNLEGIAFNICTTAVLAGDVETLRVVSQRAQSESVHAKEFLSVLDQNGMLEHLNGHQQIIRNMIATYQCSGFISVFNEEGDGPYIACEYEVLVDHQELRHLEKQIHARLKEYYRSKGLVPGYHLGRLGSVLIPAKCVSHGNAAA